MKRKLLILILVILSLFLGACTGAMFNTEEQQSEKRNTIDEIVEPKSEWEKVATGEGFIEGINFDRDGLMWLVSPVTGEILNVEGEVASPVGGTYGNPNGAKFHKDGRLFVTDQTGELYGYNTETGERSTIVDSYDGSDLEGLNDLIFDETGGVYFTSPFGSDATNPIGRVYYLPPGENAELMLFQDNMAYPNGIAVSADDQRVYIAEFDKNRVIAAPAVNAKDSPETPFVFARFEGGIGPDGLAVDTEGNLYVAHFQAGQIVVIDKNGFKYGSIRLPEEAGTFVSNLAFHAGYLYISESDKNEVWRIQVTKDGLQPYGLQ